MSETKTRRYCYMTGNAYWSTHPNGEDCPECGIYGAKHRVLDSRFCGHAVWCGMQERIGMSDYRYKEHTHGHPCSLPPDHEGPHKDSAECKEHRWT
jgi:hypothetical protein